MWLLVATVVVAIYSTLGLTGTIAERLEGQEARLDVFLFLLVLGLVALTVLVHGLGVRLGKVEIVAILGLVAVFLMLFLRTTIAERTHLVEYGVLAVLVHGALQEGVKQGRRVPLPALLAFLFTALVGTVDEYVQLFLPFRVFDPVDILFNTLAAACCIGTARILAWARYRSGRVRLQ